MQLEVRDRRYMLGECVHFRAILCIVQQYDNFPEVPI